MKTRILVCAVLALCLVACEGARLREENLKCNDISLTIEGKQMIVYDSLRFQLGFNNARNEFRVHDDELNNIFVLQCDERPYTEEQELSANLSYRVNGGEMRSSRLFMVVQKIDRNGHIWLWDGDSRTGAVVYYRP